jgi:hypothetical protein
VLQCFFSLVENTLASNKRFFIKKTLSALLVMTSMAFAAPTIAQNDVYGTVSDIYYRAGNDTNDPARLYFRMNVSNGTAESCMSNGTEIVWDVNLDTKVSPHIIALLEKSRAETKVVRVLGMHNVCESGASAYSDTVFEIMPNWSPST